MVLEEWLSFPRSHSGKDCGQIWTLINPENGSRGRSSGGFAEKGRGPKHRSVPAPPLGGAVEPFPSAQSDVPKWREPNEVASFFFFQVRRKQVTAAAHLPSPPTTHTFDRHFFFSFSETSKQEIG